MPKKVIHIVNTSNILDNTKNNIHMNKTMHSKYNTKSISNSNESNNHVNSSNIIKNSIKTETNGINIGVNDCFSIISTMIL